MRSSRLHHIDALRGSVMLLLVPYHGLLFLQNRGEHVAGLDFSVFWLHLWRMGLFFAVSGFLAAMTLGLWGPAKQTRQRLVRIGIPLAVGMVTILPLQRLVVLWFVNHRHPGSTDPAHEWTLQNIFGWAPNHLWFLSYLLVLNLAALLVWMTVRRSPAIRDGLDRGFRRLAGGPLLVPALAAACATALWAGGFVEAPGIVSTSLIPHASPLAYYAVFFLFGWMLFRSRDLLPRVEDRPWAKLGLGMALAVLAWALFQNHVNLPAAVPLAWTISFTGGLASWLILFGVWGLFARFLSGARPWVRYLADSAYWVYLIHIPFLVAFQLALAGTGLHPVVRLGLATVGALALSFLTYATLVRHTPIGWLLHGKRKRRERGSKDDRTAPPGPAASAPGPGRVPPSPSPAPIAPPAEEPPTLLPATVAGPT